MEVLEAGAPRSKTAVPQDAVDEAKQAIVDYVTAHRDSDVFLSCFGQPEAGFLEEVASICADEGVNTVTYVNSLMMLRTCFNYKGNGQKNLQNKLTLSMTILAAIFGKKQEHTALSDCHTQHHVMTAFVQGLFRLYEGLDVDFSKC